MRKGLSALLLILLALAAAGCGGDDNESAGGGTTTTEASCDRESLDTLTPGQLTIGTDNPAFPPWFEGTKKFDPWDPTTAPTKKGYEAEVAYGIAHQLGYTDDEVKWIAVPFLQAFKPGSKKFDFDINQISFNPDRAEAVDFSDSYYDVEQAIVGLESNPIATTKSIADLKQRKLGAVVGTTSLKAINDQIEPDSDPSVYDTNNDVLSAITAKQIDGGVVDFPTALYMAAVQLKGGTVVGRLPATEGGEHFGVVLAKGSSLTGCVNEAIAALHEDGTIDRLEQTWLGGSAPVLE
jgi:polar amino acid transport system substrate-binding protein